MLFLGNLIERTVMKQDLIYSLNLESDGGAGSTAKVLVQLQDKEGVELVFIPAKGKTTLCVSSQVGCKYKCAFCASGQSGFCRNLEIGEIVGGVVYAAR